MSKAQKKSTPTADKGADLGNLTGSVEKLDRIRELIFGQQIRDYSQKFDSNNRELERLQNEISRLGEQLREKEKALVEQAKIQDERLTTLMQDLDKRHTQQLQELDKRHTKQIEELDQKQFANVQELRTVLTQTDESIRAELRETAKQLTQDKANRFTLGDFLIELGNSLKERDPDQDVIDLLEELGEELE